MIERQQPDDHPPLLPRAIGVVASRPCTNEVPACETLRLSDRQRRYIIAGLAKYYDENDPQMRAALREHRVSGTAHGAANGAANGADYAVSELFFSEAHTYQPLTGKAERNLFGTIETGLGRYIELCGTKTAMDGELADIGPDDGRALQELVAARHILTNCNLLLAAAAAKPYRKRYPSNWHGDILHASTEELLGAIATFRLERGAKFSTYAYNLIYRNLADKVPAMVNAVSMPRDSYKTMRAVMRSWHQLTSELGDRPSPREIAADTGLGCATVIEIMDTYGSISLNAACNPEDDTGSPIEIGDVLPAPPAVNGQDRNGGQEQAVGELLSLAAANRELSDRQLFILGLFHGLRSESLKGLLTCTRDGNILRYGVVANEPGAMSAANIAELLGVSTSTVDDTLRSATLKLRRLLGPHVVLARQQVVPRQNSGRGNQVR